MMQSDKIPAQLGRFLDSGAFYRLSPDRIRLYWDPWKAAGENFHLAFQEFFGSELKGYLAAEVQEFTRGDLIRFLEPALGGTQNWKRGQFEEPAKIHFEQAFQVIQGKIQRGEIEKAVPIVFAKSTARPNAFDLAGSLLNLLGLPLELSVFGFWDSGRGVMGATPEILFHRKALMLQTVALAGTCPREELETRIPLLLDPKEMREHELVVNDIVARLKPLGWLKKYDTEVLELPTMQHLRTRFEVSGITKRDSELVKLLHPTPALGVAPRAYGHQWMRELPEQKDRGLFGAPLLFCLGTDETLAMVAIRSILWDEAGSRVGSGCGVVGSSEFDREWNELAVKRESVYKMLGLK